SRRLCIQQTRHLPRPPPFPYTTLFRSDETLRTIARELADKVRKNATIDWTLKESVRAKLMVLVRRTLNKYGYPPDKQQRAVETRSEEHTSELQSRENLVCRLLLEKKNK